MSGSTRKTAVLRLPCAWKQNWRWRRCASRRYQGHLLHSTATSINSISSLQCNLEHFLLLRVTWGLVQHPFSSWFVLKLTDAYSIEGPFVLLTRQGRAKNFQLPQGEGKQLFWKRRVHTLTSGVSWGGPGAAMPRYNGKYLHTHCLSGRSPVPLALNLLRTDSKFGAQSIRPCAKM